MLHGLRHIIEISLLSTVDGNALPESKSVDEEILHTTLEQRIGSAVVELVPAVGETDLDVGELLLDLVDSVEEIVGGHVAAVEGLRADCDGLDNILVTGNVLLKSFEIVVEGCLNIRPGKKEEKISQYSCSLLRRLLH